ncbi:MAG: energy transducer TonB [Pyrinomonadaceae bacterium]
MKFCPTCQTRFDEEILRFCTKDGTPLVEEKQPSFTEMPSESAINKDDFGEETIISRKPAPPTTDVPLTSSSDKTENLRNAAAPRIVIPTIENKIAPPIQTKTTQVYRQTAPPKSNTAKIVFLTILGTIVLLAAAGGTFLFLRHDGDSVDNNRNINTNLSPVDVNLNTNLGVSNSLVDFSSNIDSNTNLNTNINTNVRVNTNIIVKTPTPRPSPSPTVTSTPNANANQNSNNINAATTPVNTRPITTPTPADTPPRTSPTETAPPSNRPVNAGVLNGRAVNLPTPAYPPTARQVRASGRVTVQVLVDEGGNVISAKATGGHPMLRAPAEAAARQSRFNPVKVNDRSVQVTGVVLYNFINQ